MLKTAALTDVGRVRLVNEDRAVVQEDINGVALAILADGMGGHQAGDIASQMAVDIIHQHLQSLAAEASVHERKSCLKDAVELANEKIFEFASQRENYHGMGTTVVVAMADEDTVVIGHVGDSRVYRINQSGIEQLTEDHSLVNVLVKSGQITREEAGHHPRRNVLTRALGTESTIEIDIQDLSWQHGDTLLLCSDGLSSLISSEQIVAPIQQEAGSLEEIAQQLVNEALTAGGDDNITVVLVSNESDTQKAADDVNDEKR
ncbi:MULTISPECIES: Stp1/IreP family PP2C-type Ser/Thr phosphatase [Paenibacillus]|uniref:Stp1/IreP family PP2C-type Ser/Thr phosphatase n=1 Tax=Paenibacillus baimaensis TaxID=2982185 RepID=A0ABT2UMM4_9BACL|nr:MULTISPECIES: Stp1/IreP family PP2C-type Ser/Thr phosphatase [unclassified Paenibacillus]MCU6795266.1 Stp1/IreP family PP2C-type Ser/Thr phosphatase [Paenibacillus sp. WQ 127069]OMF14543.1 serine/threonine protein phosphatase [Paenibacillus sp. FSL H7-0331]